MINEVAAVTEALIKFHQSHDLYIPEALHDVQQAAVENRMDDACRIAFGIKPFGMGSLTDQFPTPGPGEDDIYCRVIHEALVNHWCFRISCVHDDNNTYWKRVIKAIGSLGHK